jgi:myo-inositol-1(or 4)-monophosphatase
MGGALIVEEAGGLVTGLDGSPWNAHRGHILASNGLIHEEMLRVVEAAA